MDHIEGWHEFANNIGHRIELEDLMLVTGVDLTTSWANAVWANTRIEAGFGLQVNAASAGGLTCRYTWQSTDGAYIRSAPAPEDGIIAPLNTVANQAVFIRRLRAKRGLPWRGIKLEARGEKDEEDPDHGHTDDADGMVVEGAARGALFVSSDPEQPKVR